MLRWIDDALLNVAQKFCDKVQMYTGITKFRLDKWSFLVFTAAMITIDIVGWLEATRPFGVSLLLSMIFLLAGWRHIVSTERAEKEFFRNGTIRYSLVYTTGWRYFVLISMGTCVVIWILVAILVISKGQNLELLLYITAFAAYISSMYFANSKPRPPGKSKFRKWADAALTWFNSKLKPQEAPVPT